MNDRISLIAAAAGGLMLSLAASSIIHAAPVFQSLTGIHTKAASSISTVPHSPRFCLFNQNENCYNSAQPTTPSNRN